MKTLTVQQVQAIETKMLEDVIEIFYKHAIPYFALAGTALGAVRHKGTIPWDYDVDLGIPYSFLTKVVEVLRQELGPEYSVIFHDTDKKYAFFFPRVALTGVSHAYLHIDLFPLIGVPDDPLERTKMLSAFNEIYRFYPMKKHKPVWAKTFFRKVVKTILYEMRQAVYPKSVATLESEYDSLCKSISFEEASCVYMGCPDEGGQKFFPKEWLQDGVRVPYHYLELTIPKAYDAYLTHTYGDYLSFPRKEEQEKGLAFTMEVPQQIVIPYIDPCSLELM